LTEEQNQNRHYKLAKSDRPEDLVFQSVKTGAPMRNNNILSRHIKPAAQTRPALDQLALLAHLACDLDG
jgi:hypothetical protein